jgi:hypothetical protein
MLKELTTYVTASAISFACLGLIALVMVRERIKDIDVGPFDE